MARLFTNTVGKKFCFIHIYKTGGTSLREILPQGVEIAAPHAAYTDIKWDLPECSSFSVVRHPYYWHYSHYRHILESRPHEHHAKVSQMTFMEFLEYFQFDLMDSRPWREKQSNYTLQSTICHGVDEVFRIEDLSQEIKPLSDFLEMKLPPLPWRNTNKNQIKRISDKEIQFINDYFSPDFHKFGYRKVSTASNLPVSPTDLLI